MDYPLVQYGCDKCGELTEVMDCDQPLPEGWTCGDGRHTHYCPKCSNIKVDLEKHLKEDIEDVLFDLDGVAVKGATHYLTVEDVKNIAKHFFELGLKAQKGEGV